MSESYYDGDGQYVRVVDDPDDDSSEGRYIEESDPHPEAGDEPITRDEVENLITAKQPIVRARGEYGIERLSVDFGWYDRWDTGEITDEDYEMVIDAAAAVLGVDEDDEHQDD